MDEAQKCYSGWSWGVRKKSCGDICYHRTFAFMILHVTLSYSQHTHVVLWLQGYLQHFGSTDVPLHAGCGDGLPSDAVDLVEGVRFQKPLISRPNEDLQR